MEKVGDFSGGPVIKNPPSKAGDAGLTPHAVGQLSLHSATTEPVCHNEDPVQPKKKKKKKKKKFVYRNSWTRKW